MGRGGIIPGLSNLTFGIYLVHIIIMRRLLWYQDWIISISNYMIQSLVIALVTFILSALFCWMLSFIPYSQWFIGYHRKISQISR